MFAHIELGAIDAGRACAAKALARHRELLEEGGLRHLVLLLALGLLEHDAGCFDAAMLGYRRAAEAAARLGDGRIEATATGYAALARLEFGAPDLARESSAKRSPACGASASTSTSECSARCWERSRPASVESRRRESSSRARSVTSSSRGADLSSWRRGSARVTSISRWRRRLRSLATRCRRAPTAGGRTIVRDPCRGAHARARGGSGGGLGVCTPGTGSCADGKAKTCNERGDGYVEFTCDALQGMKCEPGGCKGACTPTALGHDDAGCHYYPTVTANVVWRGFDNALTGDYVALTYPSAGKNAAFITVTARSRSNAAAPSP